MSSFEFNLSGGRGSVKVDGQVIDNVTRVCVEGEALIGGLVRSEVTITVRPRNLSIELVGDPNVNVVKVVEDGPEVTTLAGAGQGYAVPALCTGERDCRADFHTFACRGQGR